MPNAFLRHIEQWLLAALRIKAIENAREDRLHPIGASDVAAMLSDYVLTSLGTNPTACWTACEIDHVTDAQIVDATGFPADLLAAAFIGANLELTPWEGDDGIAFLVEHDVPPDDAREFAAAVDVVAEKFGARAQSLIQQLTRAEPPSFAHSG